MRRKFGKLINELAKKDDKIVLLVGDIGYGIFDDFRKNHPKKFFNLGICEQSLIGTASGMALEGLKPWVYTITPFLIERPFEQIKLDIDQQMFLINFIQQKCWEKTKNKNIAKKLENLKSHLKGFIQPRLAWEVTLLKIAIEDL